MKSMRILVDTNIIVDYIANREPYVANACRIMELCISKTIEGCIADNRVNLLAVISRICFLKQKIYILEVAEAKTAQSVQSSDLYLQ